MAYISRHQSENSSLEYVERLAVRNEFLIASHHPLRETVMRQAGATQ